jgi:cytochrome c biogenesis protein CcmG/thiol:disulfide interchange protein DsbE
MNRLLIIALLAGLALSSPAWSETAPQVGCQVPELAFKTVTGKTISLQERLGREKVVLTFFTSWSKSCQAEIKALNELAAANPAKLQVLAVSFDKKSKDLLSFLDRTDPCFPVLHDKKLSAINTFQILIIPTTFCLNRDGVIEKIFVDYDENVKKAIEEWLGS